MKMSDYASQQRNPRRHLVGIGLVILSHALLFYAINSGLARKFVKVIQGPVEAKLIEESKPDLPVPPPPPPKALPPPPPPAYVPPVDVPQTTAPAAVNAIAAVTTAQPVVAPPVVIAPPAPPPTPAPPPPLVRVPAVLNAAVNCQKPEYPAASRREEEEGTVLLKFLVEVDGKVAKSQVEKSSGFARLDEAARTALSRCQFRPGTLDGKPEQSWASIRYTWRLE